MAVARIREGEGRMPSRGRVMRSAQFVVLLGAAVLTPPAPAQGHIRRPTRADTTAYLIHFDRGLMGNIYQLYFPGWTTIAPPPGLDGPGSQGTGLETSGEIRDVSGAQFVEEDTGKTLEEMQVFPFSSNASVVQNLHSGLGAWYGFNAAVGTVPAYQPGALVFTMTSVYELERVRRSMFGARLLECSASVWAPSGSSLPRVSTSWLAG